MIAPKLIEVSMTISSGGSPESSTSRSASQAPAGSDSAALRDVAAQFEALLFKEAFAPLSKAMGFYGDAVVTAAAQAMMRSAGNGLTGPLEAAMSSAARDGLSQ